MSILVEADDVTVDLNPAPKADPVEPKPAADEFVMPDKLAGKSAEEIAKIYVAEQSYVGEMKNQLGDYRNMTDRFLSLEEKRVADLGNEAAPEEIEIDPTELLANPRKVLDDYYAERRNSDPEVQGLAERLDRIEGQVGQSALADRHSDAAEVAASPEFMAWLNENSFRGRIAQQAVSSKDSEALDYLLTEFKGEHGASPANTDEQTSGTEADAARAVSTESSSTGSSVNTQKRFSRRKLVNLKITNPDEYSARSQEILMAYADGRVDD
jgi:hypothetical protein